MRRFTSLLVAAVLICLPLTATVDLAIAQGVVAVVEDPGTTISIGTWIGLGLIALAVMFGGMAVAKLWVFADKLAPGVAMKVGDEWRARISTLLVNGLFAFANQAAERLKGTLTLTTKNDALEFAVKYAEKHGREYLDKLGVKAGDPDVREALKAQAAKALADPAVPTPPELTPEEGKPPILLSVPAKA